MKIYRIVRRDDSANLGPGVFRRSAIFPASIKGGTKAVTGMEQEQAIKLIRKDN
jgi:hypothetical protein